MSAFATSSSSASAEEATTHEPPSPPPLLTPLQSVAAHGGRRGYVDVHAHIIHEKFIGQEGRIADDCVAHGLDYVVVNGLEPASNRQILAYAAEYPTIMLPALGIYPLDAACHAIYTDEQAAELEQLHQARSTATGDDTATASPSLAPWPLPASPNWKHPFPPPAKFDVQAEIDFIEAQLQAKTIVAIGECGMDGHYLTDAASLAAQEAVLRQLLRLGVKYDVPVILHTRKVEKRVFDLLVEEGVRKADFHCYCGKVR
jgi:TatD DNase family protein